MLGESERFSEQSRELVRNPEHELFLSSAVAWETAIKFAMGKLRLPKPPSALVGESLTEGGITALPILHSHALRAGGLPPHHRDPFDRLLIAQAQIEELTVLTADPWFARYEVAVHWA
jgi:PIN domain nuclease of toxin-antitoxin system